MPNPDVTPDVSRAALADSFPGRLGIELLAIEEGLVKGRMAIDKRHLHPGGYVHGGAWVAFADTIAAWGTMRNLPPGYDLTTIELKTNVFAAAREGDVLTGTGTPVHLGRRTQVWQVDVFRGERRAALFVCTQMVLAPAEASPGRGDYGDA